MLHTIFAAHPCWVFPSVAVFAARAQVGRRMVSSTATLVCRFPRRAMERALERGQLRERPLRVTPSAEVATVIPLLGRNEIIYSNFRQMSRKRGGVLIPRPACGTSLFVSEGSCAARIADVAGSGRVSRDEDRRIRLPRWPCSAACRSGGNEVIEYACHIPILPSKTKRHTLPLWENVPFASAVSYREMNRTGKC